jgi:hypothetical protein
MKIECCVVRVHVTHTCEDKSKGKRQNGLYRRDRIDIGKIE